MRQESGDDQGSTNGGGQADRDQAIDQLQELACRFLVFVTTAVALTEKAGV